MVDPRTLTEILMVLKDAGVEHFECGDFTVKFPAPQVEVPRQVEVVVAPRDRGITDEPTNLSNYDKLFRGNKPTLGRAAE